VLTAAERASFDDVWLAEHHFIVQWHLPVGGDAGAYVLGRTRQVSVCTAVSVLSTWHPVALAEQAALLDQVYGGGSGSGGARRAGSSASARYRWCPAPRTRPHRPAVVAATTPPRRGWPRPAACPVLLGLHAGDDTRQELMGCYAAAAGYVPVDGRPRQARDDGYAEVLPLLSGRARPGGPA
jgi:hypothetical protein